MKQRFVKIANDSGIVLYTQDSNIKAGRFVPPPQAFIEPALTADEQRRRELPGLLRKLKFGEVGEIERTH